MTKKDYEMVAKAIRERTVYAGYYIMKDVLIAKMCFAFKDENDKFDSDKFWRACKKEVRRDENSVERRGRSKVARARRDRGRDI